MSGHSKWANIKHKKGKTDALKAKLATKIGREITVAARMGGADPTGNMRLKLALQKARENNIPKDNIQRAIDKIHSHLSGGLAFLATVGSTAPFVGLFGTVWGIYHALTAIGVSGQASIDKVAGPVGEALIMTAIGLAVAVPAVLGYNWLTRRNKAVMEEVRTFGSDLHAVLLSGEISTNNPVNRDMK